MKQQNTKYILKICQMFERCMIWQAWFSSMMSILAVDYWQYPSVIKDLKKNMEKCRKILETYIISL